MITSHQIKEFAYSLGFDACGICKAGEIEDIHKKHLDDWLSNAYNADMDYLARNKEKRTDPTLLVDGARSIICVALSYYPGVKQLEENPRFAYYAYGKDYHDVVKEKLVQLLDYIKSNNPEAEGRAFVDTAPILERYWAEKAGLGFIGKNSLLIIPKKGSYFFLGELILNIDLEYDTPIVLSCGNCTRCMEACPTKAIVEPKVINSNKCISYQTIENKNNIDDTVIPNLNNYLYGCDICQKACPWNKYSRPHGIEKFNPSEAFLSLSFDKLENLTIEEYQKIFKGSAVKRAKYSGIKRNLEALKKSRK